MLLLIECMFQSRVAHEPHLLDKGEGRLQPARPGMHACLSADGCSSLQPLWLSV